MADSGVLGRIRMLVPALWAGMLLTVAGMATPSAFAVLPDPEAGTVAARLLAIEARISLVLALTVAALERVQARRSAGSMLPAGTVLALGALFCTVAGYFALIDPMAAARAGAGPLSFGALHAISAALYGLKSVLVAALAWRAAGGVSPARAS